MFQSVSVRRTERNAAPFDFPRLVVTVGVFDKDERRVVLLRDPELNGTTAAASRHVLQLLDVVAKRNPGSDTFGQVQSQSGDVLVNIELAGGAL